MDTCPGTLRHAPRRRPARRVASLLARLAALPAFLVALGLAGPACSTEGAAKQQAAAEWLATIRPSPELQATLDRSLADISREDPGFRASGLRVTVIDLSSEPPRLAHLRGDDKVYPASVVKFVYLMAAYAFEREGRLRIDAELDRELSEMIRESSNQATRKVFAKLTGTEPGPELEGKAYDDFRERRQLVKRWLLSLGIRDLHAVHPTYDGGGDLFGRDQQFLRDRSLDGGLGAKGGSFPNRQAMTSNDTARLLALLATDRALTPEDSATVRRRMKRDVREQPHLAKRIAGGAAAVPGAEVYAKSGTWGPIYADAGIVRDAKGRQFALAVFTDASPPYRGEGIAGLTRRLAETLFAASPFS